VIALFDAIVEATTTFGSWMIVMVDGAGQILNDLYHTWARGNPIGIRMGFPWDFH